jgi:hypothetical protein
MKNLLYTVILFIFVISACKKNNPFTLTNTFEVIVNAEITANDPLIYSATEELDLNDNSEFKDNKDQIANYSIKSIEYLFSNYSGPAITTGSARVAFLDDKGGQLGDSLVAILNIKFKTESDNGIKKKLDVTEATLKAIQDYLLTTNMITIKIGGAASDKPIKFDMTFFVEVVADVIP